MDKIVARIKKLLALAGNNSSEAEAMLAMEKAHELLAQHGLSMSSVTQESAEKRLNQPQRVMRMPWEITVFSALGKLNFCSTYTMRYGGGKTVFFVGRESSIETARLMAEYVIDTITRLSSEAAREFRKETGATEKQWFDYRRSFRFAAATRIHERCMELRREREAGPTTTSSGTNLPALASLYTQETKANQLTLQQHGITLKKGPASRIKLKSSSGYAAGRAAGDTIALNRQVR